MKNTLIALSAFLAAFVLAPGVDANSSSMRAEAEKHYEQQDYRKAYKLYEKLAKTGDYIAQGKLAHMYANGEGTDIDLEQAYAWAVLAEQGGEAFVDVSSETLLDRASDPSQAQKRAEKLMKRYGQEALQAKAQRRAEIEAARSTGTGTGSNLSR